jgi:hypothetical protein
MRYEVKSCGATTVNLKNTYMLVFFQDYGLLDSLSFTKDIDLEKIFSLDSFIASLEYAKTNAKAQNGVDEVKGITLCNVAPESCQEFYEYVRINSMNVMMRIDIDFVSTSYYDVLSLEDVMEHKTKLLSSSSC